MILDIITLLSLILGIYMLRKAVATFPAVISCAVRWKENINLEENVKQRLNRDLIALTLIIPFCLMVSKFDIIKFRFAGEFTPEASFGLTLGTLALYYLFRLFTVNVFLPTKKRRGPNKAACNCDKTFFIILASILLITVWVLQTAGVDHLFIRKTMLWISAAIYMLMLIRKFQIFQTSHSIFSAFLYLCALEIIPTGTLMVSVIIF